MDINKVLLTGIVESRPVLTKLAQSNTPLCFFTLKVEEYFTSGKGGHTLRPNYFRIESLGRQAENTYNRVKEGGRYLVDGYLRHETTPRGDVIKVRSYGIVSDPTPESHQYKLGIEKALNIVSMSKDLDSALKALKEVAEE